MIKNDLVPMNTSTIVFFLSKQEVLEEDLEAFFYSLQININEGFF